MATELSTFLKQKIESYSVQPVVYAYGTVSRVGDGVARVTGLPGRCYGELLQFESGAFGMAIDLEEDGAGVVMLSTSDVVSVGSRVRGTGRVCDVPVGEALLGRVLDPIGRALEHPDLLLTPEDQRRLFAFIREKRLADFPVTYGCSHYLGLEWERERAKRRSRSTRSSTKRAKI